MIEKIYGAGTHLVDTNVCCEHLVIAPDAILKAPEHQYLVLTVNGNSHPVAPGEYQGDITLSVAEYYVETVYPSVNRGTPIDLEAALTVQDGSIVASQSIPAAIHGGKITGRSASEFYLGTDRENFAGIIVDGITASTTLPLRIWTYLGSMLSFLGLLYALYIIARTIMYGADVPGYASLLVFILLVGGVQMIILGILGEYIGRIFIEVKRRPLYIVEKKVNLDDDE